MQETGFDPWVRKSPLGKQPTPVCLPGKSHGQRALAGCSPWDHKELDTTELLHFTSPVAPKRPVAPLLRSSDLSQIKVLICLNKQITDVSL